jgi:ribosomal protein S18 acetylase RimI-like enzyme
VAVQQASQASRQLKIRKASPQDADVLGRKPQPMTADHRRMILENDVWLLEDAGYPLGVLELVREPGCLLIYSVAVRPGHQRRGLGRQLLAWAEHQAAEAALARLRLYPNALMIANIALYTRLGYQETEREPYLGSTLVHMAKQVGPVDGSA